MHLNRVAKNIHPGEYNTIILSIKKSYRKGWTKLRKPRIFCIKFETRETTIFITFEEHQKDPETLDIIIYNVQLLFSGSIYYNGQI